MSKVKVVITGAGGGGANNIISTIKEREKYELIGFDISPYKVARASVDSRYLVPPSSSSDYQKKKSDINIPTNANENITRIRQLLAAAWSEDYKE